VDYKKVNILTSTPCRSQTKFELRTNKVVRYFKTYLLSKCTFLFLLWNKWSAKWSSK